MIIKTYGISDNPGMKKIHVSFTGLGAGNIGDEAMLSGFLSLYKLPHGTTVEVWDKKEKALRIFSPCYEFVDFRDEALCRALCKEAGMVLLIGSTIVAETESLSWPLEVLGNKHMFCKENGVPVHAVGVGVDKLIMPQARELFQRGFLNSISSWTVRSKVSRENLLNLGVKPENIVSAADLAWLTPYKSTDNGWARGFLLSIGINPDIPILGVNVVNSSLNNLLRERMAEVFDYVSGKMGWQVVFFCNEIRDEKHFDRAAATSIAKRMKKAAIIVPNVYFTPQEMIALLSFCHITVSFRYHFTVFSMLAATLPVSFQRAEKLAELTEDVNGALLITPDDIVNGKLSDTIINVDAHYDELKAKQQVSVSDVKLRAFNNLYFIRETLNSLEMSLQSAVLVEKQPVQILWIRTDDIGDCVLSIGMLREIKQGFGNVCISVLCQNHIAELYESCPFVDRIISFDKKRACSDIAYQMEIIQKLRSLNADIALNSVYSREPITDIFTLQSGAKVTVGFDGDLVNNMTPELRKENAPLYTKLIKQCGTSLAELKRHEDFLQGIGLMPGAIKPAIYLTEEDITYADRFFAENGLKTSTTIAFFPGASHPGKIYKQYHLALNHFNGLDVVILGGEDVEMIMKKTGADFKVRFFDLSGKTTLRQCAAIISRCLIYFGADSAGAHMSCALGVPCVVVLGGGHVGRFFPYNKSTTTVSVPLECYGCNWQCKYNVCHCVDAICYEMVCEALKLAIEDAQFSRNKCRVFLQGKTLYQETGYRPGWKWLSMVGLPDFGEFVYFSGTGTAASDGNMVKRLSRRGIEWMRFLVFKLKRWRLF
ncbi:MAG: polysaccharide pyruvyl transferase family protein [Nitrospirae bacterium]|nr:polysaccharide pyruvyl transferase family protein [Nitrospirota bacterium]MBF0536177.1 polysaccharide pyruvyl transferase family protein [Nitrospirota bacterium]MBF0618199.1 polysaccharide pyruvyl transferase family protein [Nitrospirota bacterium]